MMNINDSSGIMPNKSLRQYLMIPGQDDKSDPLAAQGRELGLLRLSLCLGHDRRMKELYAPLTGQRFGIMMIADNKLDPGLGQLTRLVAEKKVKKAMKVFGNKNSDLDRFIREIQFPGHLELFGERRELSGNAVFRHAKTRQLPLHAHKKSARCRVRMLGRVNDIATALEHEISDRGGNAFLVRAGDQENSVMRLAHILECCVVFNRCRPLQSVILGGFLQTVSVNTPENDDGDTDEHGKCPQVRAFFARVVKQRHADISIYRVQIKDTLQEKGPAEKR